MWKKFKVFFRPKPKFKEETIERKGKKFLVRQAKERDIKEMLAVERDVYFGDVPWTRSAFVFELRNPTKHLYLVMEHEAQVIGFVGCRVRLGDAHITNIAVLGAFQGLGLGWYMLEQVRLFALRNEAKLLSLEVRFHNKRAQRLYRKFGFVSEKVMKNYYSEIKEDGVRMIYKLNAEK